MRTQVTSESQKKRGKIRAHVSVKHASPRMERSTGDNESSSSVERDPIRTSTEIDEEQGAAAGPRQDDLLHRQLDRDTLQAMTRSWWGSYENEGDEDASTSGDFSEGLSQLDETALEGIGGVSLAEVYDDDDDPRRHPPVASLPPQENNQVDEKDAYRRQTPPSLMTPCSGMVFPCENDTESTDSEERRPGAEAMEGPGAGERPAWAGPNLVRQGDDSEEHGGISGNLRRSWSAAWLFRRSSDSHILAEADPVHSAQMIVYATSVRPDQTTRMRKIKLGLGLLAIITSLIVGFVVGFNFRNHDSGDQDSGDPRCKLPVNEQDVFDRCHCNSTLTDLLDKAEEKYYYENVK